MDNLTKRQRAAEAEWALKAQEATVQDYRDRLLRSAEGKRRLAAVVTSPTLQASSMLPQIAAQYVRMDAQAKVGNLRWRPRPPPPRVFSEGGAADKLARVQAEVRRVTIERPHVDPLRPLPSESWGPHGHLRQPACARAQLVPLRGFVLTECRIRLARSAPCFAHVTALRAQKIAPR